MPGSATGADGLSVTVRATPRAAVVSEEATAGRLDSNPGVSGRGAVPGCRASVPGRGALHRVLVMGEGAGGVVWSSAAAMRAIAVRSRQSGMAGRGVHALDSSS